MFVLKLIHNSINLSYWFISKKKVQIITFSLLCSAMPKMDLGFKFLSSWHLIYRIPLDNKWFIKILFSPNPVVSNAPELQWKYSQFSISYSNFINSFYRAIHPFNSWNCSKFENSCEFRHEFLRWLFFNFCCNR